MKQASRVVSAPLSVRLHPGDHRRPVRFPPEGPASGAEAAAATGPAGRPQCLPKPLLGTGSSQAPLAAVASCPASSRHGLGTR